MHKKSKQTKFSKVVGSLSALLLIATALVSGQSSNATSSVPSLNFIPPIELRGFGVGDFYYVFNVDGAHTRAKYEVLAVDNLQSNDTGFTTSPWYLDWTEYVPPAGSDGLRVRWRLDSWGAWNYHPALGAADLATTEDRATLSGLPSVQQANNDRIQFQVVAFDDDVSLTVPMGGLDTTTDKYVFPTYGTNGAYVTNAAVHSLSNFSRIPGLVDRLDEGNQNRLIEGRIRTELGGEHSATFKISFEREVSGVWQPYVFPYLALNVYDMDSSQYLESENVSTYQLQEVNNIASITPVGQSGWKFVAKPTSTSGSESTTIGRLGVNYVNASSVTMKFGSALGVVNETASFDFDFSDGLAFTGVAWTQVLGPAPITPGAAPTAPAPASPAVVSAIDVNPTNITVDNEIITILGANLNTVTDVVIGGVRVPIFTQSGNRLQVRAPRGLSGLVDLELKSSLNDVLMTRKLNFGSTAATGTRKATLIVGGFAPNSRKLTARMQSRIDRWLERNSDLGTLTCTGFTSLPRLTSDVTLSTNRGKTACNFSKRQRSDLETSVSQGIEDPRPGSNVRRVRLVLTP